MKILHIIPSLAQGGAERLVLDICDELGRRSDCSVRLATLHTGNAYAYTYTEVYPMLLPVQVSLSLSGKNKIESVSLQKLLQEFKPDIVHTHLFEAELAGRAVLRRETAYFSHAHDNIPQLRRIRLSGLLSKRNLTDRYEKKWIEKKYRECRNNFIAISRDTKTYLEKNLPADLRSRVTLLHNAIRYQRFANEQEHRPGTPLRLVNCGSFTVQKNQSLLADIMQHLRHSGIHALLTLAGDGKLKSEVQHKAQALGVDSMMEFAGSVRAMEDVYPRHDIYMHTALHEPFGLVLLEAMAAGLPVIALAGGGIRDVVKDGENGFLISQPDPELFSERVRYLLEHPEVYQAMSNNARQFAAGFDIPLYVNRLMELYREARSKT
jgi:glycosyltransferase involved in cell wall biosynthesis